MGFFSFWRNFSGSVCLVFLAVFLCYSSAVASEVKRVVVIVTMPVAACEEHLKYFLDEFDNLGYENGKNVDLVIIRANGDRQFAETELQKVLAEGKIDAVATIATLASQAAVKVLQGTDIPIFFFQVSDPVGAGLVKELRVATGSNITGRNFAVPQEVWVDMTMRLVKQAIPSERPIRFGYIYSSYPSAISDLKKLKALGQERDDVVFESYQIAYKKVPAGVPEMMAEVGKGITSLQDKVDFWWEPRGPLGELDEYTKLLVNGSSVSVVMGQSLESVENGALFHINPDLEAGGREAATYIDAILKGANPGDMPVVPPPKFRLGINITTALKLNIIIPPEILLLAGKNIYR